MSDRAALSNLRGAKLARSYDGSMVHKLECQHARTPWVWTADKFPYEVYRSVYRMGMRLCGHCKPLERWKIRDHDG